MGQSTTDCAAANRMSDALSPIVHHYGADGIDDTAAHLEVDMNSLLMCRFELGRIGMPSPIRVTGVDASEAACTPS